MDPPCKKCKDKGGKCCCNICSDKGDAANMLMCDKCEYYQHYYWCEWLDPPLEGIPDGDW